MATSTSRLPPIPQQTPVLQDGGIISFPWSAWLNLLRNTLSVGGVPNLTGTRADRVAISAANYPPGTLFYETDSTLFYIVEGSNWVYSSGTYQQTQAELAALIAALGTNDSEMLIEVTDYGHVLRWTGTALDWGPNDLGSAYFQDFGAAPTKTGWHACDGTTVNYLKADGTLGSLLLPNSIATASYRKLGSIYSAAITAAVNPTLAMNPFTPAGTNSIPALTMDSYTPAGTLSINNFTPTGTVAAPTWTGASVALTQQANVAITGATTVIAAVGGSQVSFTPTGTNSAPAFSGISGPITGTFAGTPAVLTGTISAPTFTGTPATLTGTVSLAGDPVAHHQAMEYFRQ